MNYGKGNCSTRSLSLRDNKELIVGPARKYDTQPDLLRPGASHLKVICTAVPGIKQFAIPSISAHDHVPASGS